MLSKLLSYRDVCHRERGRQPNRRERIRRRHTDNSLGKDEWGDPGCGDRRLKPQFGHSKQTPILDTDAKNMPRLFYASQSARCYILRNVTT